MKNSCFGSPGMSPGSRAFAPLVLTVLGLLGAVPALGASFDAVAFDAYIEKVRQDWRVPGIAIAVVNRSGVIHMRGYGVREWETATPVDGNTIFAIGSNGKSFTAVLLGALADRHMLELNDPISHHLSGFRMMDPYATANASFEDALAHLTGLPEQSGLPAMYLFGLNRREMVSLVARIPPATSLRGAAAYNNTMFTVAGEAAAAVTGKSYDDAIGQYVLRPAGMSRTFTTLAITREDNNVAAPHVYLRGVPTRVPYHDIVGGAPAGSINSTARDMARYLRMFLNQGSVDGKQVLTPAMCENLQALRRIFVRDEMAPIRQLFGTLADPAQVQDFGYGLGLAHMRYGGAAFVMHGGSIDGMTSWMAWSPQLDFGIVVLTNSGNMLVPALLMFAAVNPLLGLPPDDALGRMLKQRDQILRGPAPPSVEKRFPAAIGVSDLVGSYSNYLGVLDIFSEGQLLRLRIARTGYQASIRHLNRDTYAVIWDNPALPVLTLLVRTNLSGAPIGLDLAATDTFRLSAADGAFEKQRNKK